MDRQLSRRPLSPALVFHSCTLHTLRCDPPALFFADGSSDPPFLSRFRVTRSSLSHASRLEIPTHAPREVRKRVPLVARRLRGCPLMRCGPSADCGGTDHAASSDQLGSCRTSTSAVDYSTASCLSPCNSPGHSQRKRRARCCLT
jgi:hypothetical protein